jgi:hypothetical protein
MKNKRNFVLFLALSAGTLATSAVAQDRTQLNDRENEQVKFSTFDPAQAGGLLQPADWDDRHRCDGDHDRDDRNCYYRDRDRDGDWYRDHAYRGSPYRGGYYQNGTYDRKGNFYPAGGNGYYDKHGRWHYFNGRRDRDDRW